MVDDNHLFANLLLLGKKITSDYDTLSEKELEDLRGSISVLQSESDTINTLLAYAKRLQMYDELKNKEIKSSNKQDALDFVVSRIKEDDLMIANAKRIVEENKINKDYMFGYPANLFDVDPVEEILKQYEAQLPYMNNCGDSSTKTRGNYIMDSKEYEEKILECVFNNLNVSGKDYWGYITSGGTEGNFWGLRTGFELYPNGKLYFSSSTHYSVPKFVRLVDNKKNPTENINIFENEEIPSLEDGRIDAEKLINKIVMDYNETGKPVILLLNWGTTVVGAIDDVQYITKKLNLLGIPHYVHLDAALFGGVGKNQENSPAIKDLGRLNVDSVSISLHKYIGSMMTNGVLICKKEVLARKNNLQIEYIGQEDPTYLGSRSLLPISTYYRIRKLYERTDPKEYEENINFFKECADNEGLEYQVHGNSNIIVVRINNSDIQHKYQLATFGENNEFAHIILFPHHKKEIIRQLVDDLVKIQKKSDVYEKIYKFGQ